MDPGELDKRIALVVVRETGRDAAGAPILTERIIAKPWAKVVQQGGREFLANDATQTEKRVVFRIWARSDFDTTAIVRYAGQEYDIKDIRPFDDVTEIHAETQKVAA